jgi:hypothetical protein
VLACPVLYLHANSERRKLKDWAFTLAYLLGSSAFMVTGLLAVLLPPERYHRIFGRLWPVRRPGTRGQDLQRRLVGLVLALLGASGVKAAFSTVYSLIPRTRPQGLEAPPGNVTSSWLPLGVGLAISLGGLYLLVNPGPLVRWSQRRLFPERQVPEVALRIWRVAFRLMGALMMYSSADLFRLGLRR